MEWKEWNGKRIFVKLRDGGVYSGNVIDVDVEAKPIIFITLIDKFGDKVSIVSTEIIKIVEERIR